MLKLGESSRAAAEGTRERILAATREIFLLNGTRGTTTRDIAELAGVNEATIFRHFKTKAALVDQMREHYCDAQRFRSVVERFTGDVEQDLRSLALYLLKQLTDIREMICISLAEEARDPGGAEMMLRGPLEIKQRVLDYLRAQVAAGTLRGEPEVLAKVFLGMLFGCVVPKRLMGSSLSVEQVAVACVEIFLNGVRENRGSA